MPVSVAVVATVALPVIAAVSVSVVHRSTRQRKAICSQQLGVAVGAVAVGVVLAVAVALAGDAVPPWR